MKDPSGACRAWRGWVWRVLGEVDERAWWGRCSALRCLLKLDFFKPTDGTVADSLRILKSSW